MRKLAWARLHRNVQPSKRNDREGPPDERAIILKQSALYAWRNADRADPILILRVQEAFVATSQLKRRANNGAPQQFRERTESLSPEQTMCQPFLDIYPW